MSERTTQDILHECEAGSGRAWKGGSFAVAAQAGRIISLLRCGPKLSAGRQLLSARLFGRGSKINDNANL
jgi:hypothetical protein